MESNRVHVIRYDGWLAQNNEQAAIQIINLPKGQDSFAHFDITSRMLQFKAFASLVIIIDVGEDKFLCHQGHSGWQEKRQHWRANIAHLPKIIKRVNRRFR
jgi:hypothetical protein